MLYNSKLTLKEYIEMVGDALPPSLLTSRFIFDDESIYDALIGNSGQVKSSIHMMERDRSFSSFELYQIIRNNKKFGERLINKVELYAVMDDDDEMITEHIVTPKDNIEVNLKGQVYLYYRNNKGYMKSKNVAGLFKIYLKTELSIPTVNLICQIQEKYIANREWTLAMSYDNWLIYKRGDEWCIIDPDKNESKPIKIEFIKDAWILPERYNDCHACYDNDYYGEFDMLFSKAGECALEKLNSGFIHVGWFKIIEE